MNLAGGQVSRRRYGDMVGRLWGIYRPLEQDLAAIDWVGAETLVRSRRKTPWLEADLEVLGIDRACLPEAESRPSVTDAADVLGVLYVLEGATLGGQVVTHWLRESLGLTRDTGGQFFASYGERVGVMWRAFVNTLDSFGANPETSDRIESAALNTFTLFEAWMGAEPRTPMAGTLRNVT